MNLRIILAAITVVSIFVLGSGCAEKKHQHERPNIVLIYADDLGYGDLGCYNENSKIPTPNIDKMASQGMLFTDAHSADALCTPSRYALLTGRYCWRTRVKTGALPAWDTPLINKNRLTLPEMLKEKGYQTAAIGKWHLGWDYSTKDSLTAKEANGYNVDYSRNITGGPREHGFDYYFGVDVPNYPPYTFIENDRVLAIPTVMKPDSIFGHKGMMVEGWSLEQILPKLAEKAVNFIKNKSSDKKPFFLYFPLTAPHTPIAPTEQFKGKSKAGRYGDFVNEVDWVVGEVLNALKNNNVAKNTIVIFTSDNGSVGVDGTNYRGERGSIKKYGHLTNGNLRGYKAELWEGGHRVPFILRWPGKVKNGETSSELICQIDMMKTIAEITGYELPENACEDSYNILPALMQENDKAIREALVHHAGNGSFAIRKGEWKLILTNKSGGWVSEYLNKEGFGITTPWQLYNIRNDIEEKNNLYEEHPEIVKDLKSLLSKYINEGRSTPGTTQQNDSIDFEWVQIGLINN